MILVTGATGFIGRVLVKRLVSDGQHVIRAARRATSTECEVLLDDIESFQGWREVLRGVHTVIHLAGRAHILKERSDDALESFRAINTRATIALARHAASAAVKRFILISSIGVNGDETHGKPFSADDAPRPCSPYAVSKYEAELALTALSQSTGLEVVVIRPPLVHGPNAPGNLRTLVHWISRGLPLPLGAVTDNRRSFVGVDNLVDLIATCLDHPAAANQTFLVSDGEDLSTAEFLRRLSCCLGRRAFLVPVPPRALRRLAHLLGKDDIARRLLGSLQIDIHFTRERLGWTPPFSLDEGFARIAAHERTP